MVLFHIPCSTHTCELKVYTKRSYFDYILDSLSSFKSRKIRPFKRGSMWCDVCVHRLYKKTDRHQDIPFLSFLFFLVDIQWFSFLNEFSVSFPEHCTCVFGKNNEIMPITRISQQWSEWTNERWEERDEREKNSGAHKRCIKNGRNKTHHRSIRHEFKKQKKNVLSRALIFCALLNIKHADNVFWSVVIIIIRFVWVSIASQRMVSMVLLVQCVYRFTSAHLHLNIVNGEL